GPLDHYGGAGRGSSGRRAFGLALHSLPFAPATHLCRKTPQCHAAEIRRPRGTNRRREAGPMTLATHNGLKEALEASAELRPAGRDAEGPGSGLSDRWKLFFLSRYQSTVLQRDHPPAGRKWLGPIARGQLASCGL